jgi:hypothetical protein
MHKKLKPLSINMERLLLKLRQALLRERRHLCLFSKALIKYAYFVYIETLVEMNALTQEVGYPLVYTYALLSTFIDDDEAVKVNQLYGRANQSELDWSSQEGELVRVAMRGVTGSPELKNEINEFIEACYQRHRPEPT